MSNLYGESHRWVGFPSFSCSLPVLVSFAKWMSCQISVQGNAAISPVRLHARTNARTNIFEIKVSCRLGTISSSPRRRIGHGSPGRREFDVHLHGAQPVQVPYVAHPHANHRIASNFTWCTHTDPLDRHFRRTDGCRLFVH